MNQTLDLINNRKSIRKFNDKIFEDGIRTTANMQIEINNAFRVIEVDTIPHHNQQGKVDYLLCLAEDITDELEKEKRFYRAKKRYRSIFKKAPLAFVVSDRDTNIIDWNDKANQRELMKDEFHLKINTALIDIQKEIYSLIRFTNQKLKY